MIVLTPIWDKLFTALDEAHHGKGPFCEDNILLHCHHGESRTTIVLIALLAGYFWKYKYTIKDLYDYIVQPRPIVELEHQDVGLVRRVEGLSLIHI